MAECTIVQELEDFFRNGSDLCTGIKFELTLILLTLMEISHDFSPLLDTVSKNAVSQMLPSASDSVVAISDIFSEKHWDP